MITTQTAVEVLRCQPEPMQVSSWFRALIAEAPGTLDLRVTHAYGGETPWLLLWGPGAADRVVATQRHLAAGGHVIAMDSGYWQRDRKIRISIDAAHPQAWVMRRTWPRARVEADAVVLDHLWHPQGPVLVAGIGIKAQQQYGAAVRAWETAMIAACRQRWPHRHVIYRPKRVDGQPPPTGTDICQAPTQPIDRALRHCSLVVTWHSNVAVDAIRLGVPVVCRDGAAAAVCSSTLPDDDPRPLPEAVRDQFLGNLAWFQWDPLLEASALWAFLQELLA